MNMSERKQHNQKKHKKICLIPSAVEESKFTVLEELLKALRIWVLVQEDITRPKIE